MPGIRSADISIECSAEVGLLPSEALALLAGTDSVFAIPAWWNVVVSRALPPGAIPLFIVFSAKGRVVAVIPMLRPRANDGLQSLTTPYSCRYTPIFAADLEGIDRVAVMRTFARFCRSCAVVRLDALPAEWYGLPDLLAGAHAARLWTLRFNHFGNWHENVAGMSWADYLARRPGALRETIRRRLRQASRLTDARFVLLTRPAEMDRAAEAFEAVYGRSWKDPEPYPAFNTALMRAMADHGLVRFALWSFGAMPVAAQVWVVEKNGRATVLKLAHDEAFKAHSPGTVLTALALRHLLDREQITEIDFGRGDDSYKHGWAEQRRQRIGVLLINPWRPSGALQLARHTLGRVRAALLGRLSSPHSETPPSAAPGFQKSRMWSRWTPLMADRFYPGYRPGR